MNETLGSLGSKTQHLRRRMLEQKERIERVETSTGDLETDITALDGRVTTNEGDIATNSGGIAANAGAITTLDGQVSTLDGEVTAIDGRVTVNEGDILANSGNIDTNTAAIGINAGSIATNAGNIATNAGDITTLDTNKADKSNVLELDNTTVFTPNTDYEPATKKYVDDNASGTDVIAYQTNNLVITGDTTLTASDLLDYGVIYCDNTSNDIILTLPAKADIPAKDGTSSTVVKLHRMVTGGMSTYWTRVKIAGGETFTGLEKQVYLECGCGHSHLEYASLVHPTYGSFKVYSWDSGLSQTKMISLSGMTNDGYIPLTNASNHNDPDDVLTIMNGDQLHCHGADRDVEFFMDTNYNDPDDDAKRRGWVQIEEYDDATDTLQSTKILHSFREGDLENFDLNFCTFKQDHYYKFYYDTDGRFRNDLLGGTYRIMYKIL